MVQKELIITLLAEDKPGIIQRLSDVVANAGGSWLESRLSQLAGQFAGILMVSIGSDHVENLVQALKDLEGSGIQIMVKEASENQPITKNKIMDFELMGPDRTGIISEIAHAFTESGINVEDLETHCSSTPWSGESLFEAKGTLIAPEQLNKDELLDKLDAIQNAIGVNITLSEKL
ncbi:MAG: glycine cleavage system regulatory protein [Cellvibrionaceae bacterium]|jgi:glycine cleavage system regulatory protein